MQELIEKIAATAGITEEQAAKAVEATREFIQSKLPPMMHGVIDNFLGAGADGGNAQDSTPNFMD